MNDAAVAAPEVTDVPVNVEHTHVPTPSSGQTPPVEPQEPAQEPETKAEEPKGDKKPSSIDDALKKALDKAQEKVKEKEAAEKAPKAEEKPEPAKAAERGADGKFQPKAQEGAEPAQPQKPTSYPEAPSRFHDTAKGEWANAPESVRAEVHRAVQELEKGLEKYRSSHERYENLREYDEIARSNGRDLRESLQKVVDVENALARDLVGGLDMILREIGPRKHDGSPVTLFDVAHHVVNQNPDQRASQQNSTIASLQAEISQLKQAVQQTQGYVQQAQAAPAVSAIREFAEKNPRYHELEGEIATVLKSGLIPADLPLAQKLDRAYKTAVFNVDGEFPSAQTAPVPDTSNGAHPAAKPTPPINPAGQKSVSGSPAAATPPAKKGPAPSIDEALQRALRKAS